jgi:hypothetical protein
MNSERSLTNLRLIRAWSRAGVGLFMSLLLVGCAVFVSRYDEVTDQQIQAAAKTTEALIGDVVVNRTDYDQHSKDYQEIEGHSARWKCARKIFRNDA